MLMRQTLHSVGLKDREESGPTFLEMQSAADPAICFFRWLTYQPLHSPVPDSTEEYMRKRLRCALTRM